LAEDNAPDCVTRTTGRRGLHHRRRRLWKRGRLTELAPVTTKECPFCLSAVAIKATRCPYCTSELRIG